MGSLQLEVSRPSALMCVIAQSAMGRHVAMLGSLATLASLSADSLYVLTLKMPQLRELQCAVPLPPAPTPLFFPVALRKLCVHLSNPRSRPVDVNAALRTISRLSLLESLEIAAPVLDPPISFSPLAGLTHLHEFGFFPNLHANEDVPQLSDTQVDELRSLPRLHIIHVCPMPLDLMQRLLRQPHDLQWQDIEMTRPLTDEAAALLPQLPSLTDLYPTSIVCERFDWLRGLPNLRDVILSFRGSVGAAGRSASLVAGLQSCSNIEILTLEECPDLTAAHLAKLLPRLLRLRELTLRGLSIDELSFLAQPPMTGQLATVDLPSCKQLPLVELRHVHTLRGLKTLRLFQSFNEPMDSHSPSLYTPPSIIFPLLEKFEFSAPVTANDDEEDDENE